jgi:hypothetical protein
MRHIIVLFEDDNAWRNTTCLTNIWRVVSKCNDIRTLEIPFTFPIFIQDAGVRYGYDPTTAGWMHFKNNRIPPRDTSMGEVQEPLPIGNICRTPVGDEKSPSRWILKEYRRMSSEWPCCLMTTRTLYLQLDARPDAGHAH